MAKKTITNLVSTIKEDEQKEIAEQICADYDTDLDTRKEWEANRDKYYKLWACITEKKSTPWEGASNVCIPMLATAANQFHSRSYQTIFSPPGMVKTIPVSENDDKRAKNVEKYMNWQTMYEMEEYEEEFDRLLQLLPINGTAIKKLYHDKELDREVSEHISVLDFIVPYRTKNLQRARRMVHRLWMHYSEIEDRADSGFYENFDKIPETPGHDEEEELKHTADDATGETPQNDTEKDHIVLECHKKLKVGKDKKKRPYIFTVHYPTQTLTRVTEREYEVNGEKKEICHFIDYHFIHNPEGWYSFGFGHFLEPLNNMANTAFNQIFDAGRISNQPFGFYGRRAGLKKRKIKLEPGKMIEVEDASQVFFPSMQRVDQVLFMILGLIQQHVELFTSTSDYLSGRESKGTKTPTASGTLAIIEQGLVTFAVMTKRIFRSLRKELRLLMVLNHIFLPDKKEYRIMGDIDNIAFADIKKEDFEGVNDVIPIGDPSYASKMTRRQEAVELYQILMSNPLIVGNPETGEGANQRAMYEALSDVIDAYDKKNKSKLLPPLPEDPVSPEMENAMFMQGDYQSPSSGEDHMKHLQSHQDFRQGTFFSTMPDEYKALAERHESETHQVMALDSQRAQQLGGQG